MRYRRVLEAGATYFFTLVTHQREPLFANDGHVQRWHAAVTAVQRKRPFTIEAEVILPDHVHMMWTLPEGNADYATRIRLAKTAFTRSLELNRSSPSSNTSRASKGERDIWQRRYWEHTIRNERDFQSLLDYIHFNPVKHGLVEKPTDWPHSTFHAWVAKGAYDPWWGSGDMPPLPDWM
jgi:putative transposase